MRCLYLIGLLSIAVPGTAAEIYTGRELLRACTAPQDDGERRACQGWIDWAYSSPYFCLPDGVDDATLQHTLVSWLEAHGPKLHMPGGALAHNAFYAAYPCRRTP